VSGVTAALRRNSNGDIVATKKKTAATKNPTSEEEIKLVVVAGDSGVYVGRLAGGASSLGGPIVHLTSARHLRRYYVLGRKGDGSVSDLAAKGLDPASPSVSDVVAGVTALAGVRRVLDVSDAAASTFGVP
jgi:hypothetical protein